MDEISTYLGPKGFTILKEYLDRRKYVMTTQIGIEIAPENSGCISKNSTIKEINTKFKIKVIR